MAIEIIVHPGVDSAFIAWRASFIDQCRGFALKRKVKRAPGSAVSPNTTAADCCSAHHAATVLSDQPMSQPDAWRMIRRRAVAVGIHAPIGNNSFRATGITAYLAYGGALEHAQEMAAHESPRTTAMFSMKSCSRHAV